MSAKHRSNLVREGQLSRGDGCATEKPAYILCKLRSGCVAICAVLAQRFPCDSIQVSVNGWIYAGWCWKSFFDDGLVQLTRICSSQAVRQRARQELIQNQTERIDVGTEIEVSRL